MPTINISVYISDEDYSEYLKVKEEAHAKARESFFDTFKRKKGDKQC